jgi:hypothetical protein
MANPNIVNVTSIFGKTFSTELTTSEKTLITHAGGSNKVIKVNVLIASNIDGSAAADVTVRLNDGSVTLPIASTVAVPADSSLVVIDKTTSLYLEEGWSLRALASANADIQATVSYEEIG